MTANSVEALIVSKEMKIKCLVFDLPRKGRLEYEFFRIVKTIAT